MQTTVKRARRRTVRLRRSAVAAVISIWHLSCSAFYDVRVIFLHAELIGWRRHADQTLSPAAVSRKQHIPARAQPD
jgi:hypothetical protein